MTAARVKEVFLRSLRLRCPACGRTKIFESLLKVRKACPECGFTYEQEQGFFVGAIYLNTIATNAVILSVYLVSLLTSNTITTATYAIMILLAVATPLIFFRWSRSFWLGLNLLVWPPEHKD
jgi:uncharacterized protein (DUF983 family)